MKQLLTNRFKQLYKRSNHLNSIQFKVTILISICVSFASALSIIFIFSLSYNAFKYELRDKLKMLATNTAVSIDDEMLKNVTSQLDESTYEYKSLHKKLNDLQDATNHKIKYIYTIAKTRENKYIYILDATPVDDVENHSPVGSTFPIEEFPDAINGFVEATTDKEPILDKEFNIISQSAYAPIKDGDGNVIGMVGLDMDVSVIRNEEANMIRTLILTLCFCGIISILISIHLSKYLTKPILTLTKATSKVAGGDMDVSIPVDRNDELGEMTRSFNIMIHNIKVYQDELKEYTSDLELEIVQKEKEHKDNINEIIEIINMDHEFFHDFIDECNEYLEVFEPKLIKLKEDRKNFDIINDLSRIMHTIKGNAMAFNLVRIAGEAHDIESIFQAIRNGQKALTDNLLTQIFKKLDNFNQLFKETLDLYYKIVRRNKFLLDLPTEEEQSGDSDIIRVRARDLNKLTHLFNEVDRLIKNDITRGSIEFTGENAINDIESVLQETEHQLELIKMIPVNKLFDRMPRIARDLSLELDKKVKLVINKNPIEIEKNIFEKIKDPVLQILRNSIDHGIETPKERIGTGKSREGTIEINTFLESKELVVEIKDDGRGIDLESLKSIAVNKGVLTEEEASKLSDVDALGLIFMPGFSTSYCVTDVSGRGFGMDVVKTSIEKNLNGKIFLESEKNKGLKVILKVPV